MAFGVNPKTGKPGPAPQPACDGDKKQARHRVNVLVRTGKIPHPNDLPCADCSHEWKAGERRHEYDHHKGYKAKHHEDVEAVCTTCHAQRDGAKANQTSCKRGHKFNKENTAYKKNGTRICKACRRMHDKNRGRDAKFWRDYRSNRNVKR